MTTRAFAKDRRATPKTEPEMILSLEIRSDRTRRHGRGIAQRLLRDIEARLDKAKGRQKKAK